MLFNRHNSKKNGTPPKNRARGAPPPRADPPRRPITALTGCPPPRAAPGDVPGAKGSPIRQYFPDWPVDKIYRPHHIFFTSRNMNNMNISIEN